MLELTKTRGGSRVARSLSQVPTSGSVRVNGRLREHAFADRVLAFAGAIGPGSVPDGPVVNLDSEHLAREPGIAPESNMHDFMTDPVKFQTDTANDHVDRFLSYRGNQANTA